MSYFTNLGFASTHFFQWKFEAFMQVVTNPGTVYVDNIILTQNPLSVDGFQANTFNVYPNPTTNNWNVNASQIVNTVEVFDVLGKSVFKKEVNASTFLIDSANLKTGLYFVKFTSNTGINTIKLVKE
ncbi:T9SS type A sorting domain-containing protein [Olleya sp. R77988]|uniref:T9SS type A sorting domain-containing protein n=1 Tax=Olleya sp. R77988 TaxID=3093875 RepID=UPI0037C61CD9